MKRIAISICPSALQVFPSFFLSLLYASEANVTEIIRSENSSFFFSFHLVIDQTFCYPLFVSIVIIVIGLILEKNVKEFRY